MILECPACENRYLVDPRAISGKGRTVRCAKCKHQWFAAPTEEVEEALQAMEQVEEASPKTKPVPPGSSVPAAFAAAHRTPPALKWATCALLLAFMAVSAVYFRPLVIQLAPVAAPVYAKLGLYDTSGIVIADLAYNKGQVDKKDNHELSGYLVNTSIEPRILPVVNVLLLGNEGIVLKRRTVAESGQLQPGERKFFNRAIETSPESVKRVVVELGNPLELKLR